MYKLIATIKRAEGADFEVFKEWWLTEHAAKVKLWPGLKEYRINLCTTPDQEYDGVAEISFETQEAMEAVLSTEEGKRARESVIAGSSGILVLLTQEHIMV